MFAFEILSFEMFYFSELFETIASDLNVSTVMTRISIRDSEANIKEVGVGGLKFKWEADKIHFSHILCNLTLCLRPYYPDICADLDLEAERINKEIKSITFQLRADFNKTLHIFLIDRFMKTERFIR